MTQLSVVVHHRNDMPAGLPAVWVKDRNSDGSLVVNLYLRDDLPTVLADAYRVMVTRDAVPDVDLDMYAITRGNDNSAVLSPLLFA